MSSKLNPFPPIALTKTELVLPSSGEVGRLLHAAERIWKLKPWETLAEDDLFIVQNPDDGELGFVGTLGGAGEQFGVLVYRGAETYFELLDFLERSSEMPALPEDLSQMPNIAEMMAQLQEAQFDPMELLRMPQLQLMFEAKRDLDSLDKQWIQEHKFKATGRGFPTFRSLVAGYLPWWVEQKEAAFLAAALEQLIEVLERPGFSSELLEIQEAELEDEDEMPIHRLFARVPKKAKTGEITWSDARLEVSPDQEIRVELAPDKELLKRILALPRGRETIEIEVVDLPTPSGGEDERPCFPSLLMVGHKGKVAAVEPIACGPSPRRFPLLFEAVFKILAAQTKRPATIHFASDDLFFLEAIGQRLQIKVKEMEELPTLDPAVESLMEHLATGEFSSDLGDENAAPR